MSKRFANSRKPMPPARQTCARYFELRQATWQPRTIRSRRYTVLRFVALLEARYPHVRHFGAVRRHPHVERWLRSIRHLHPVTRHGYIEILDQFFQDLIDWQWPEAPPPRLLQETDLPRLPPKVPRPLDPESDRRLQQALEREVSVMGLGLRVLRQTGLRIGELLALPLDAVRTDRQGRVELKVPPGKTLTERLLPLSPSSAALIEAINARRGMNAPGRGLPPLLMIDESGHPVRYWTYRRYIKQIAQRAGLPQWQKVTPHRLRHTFATELARAQIPLPSLMRLLGHRRPDITMRYVQLTAQDVRQTYEKALASLYGSRGPAAVLTPAPPQPATTPLADFQSLIARLDCQRRDASDPSNRTTLARLVKRLRAALRTLQQSA